MSISIPPSLPIEIWEMIGLINHDVRTWIALCCIFPSLHEFFHHPTRRQKYIRYFTKYTYSFGRHEWRFNGQLHRELDLPATIYSNGYQAWYRHGKLHRDYNRPAIICSNGSLMWYTYGQLHRDCGPSIVFANGIMAWFDHGIFITCRR